MKKKERKVVIDGIKSVSFLSMSWCYEHVLIKYRGRRHGGNYVAVFIEYNVW